MSFTSPICKSAPMGREIKSIPSTVIFSAKHPGPAERPTSRFNFLTFSIDRRLTSFSVPAWESPTSPNPLWRKPLPTFFFGSVLLWLMHTPTTLPTILCSFADGFLGTFFNTGSTIDTGLLVHHRFFILYFDGFYRTSFLTCSTPCT